MRLQPVGVVGELYIGGAGLGRGYVGRPELTAEVFVADPFGVAGGRLYRTGDLARLLPDGNVEFLGRVDDQVKIRGFRVELGEIEAVVAGHPLVRGAAVVAVGEGASKRLVAFVVCREPVAGEVLQAFVGERLPGYMVPGVFVPLEALPLNSNGKVDRRALVALPWEEFAAGEREFVAPRSEVEAELARVWEEVLGTGRPVGVFDNFFALGGDSILSLQVIFRVRQRGLSFSVKQLFEFQTIAELAPVVERQDVVRVQAPQGLVTGPVELTPVQRWFFGQELARPGHFNQSVLVGVDGGLSVGQWERVVRRLLEQHDGLRARFVRVGKGWGAELAGMPEVLPWEVHDLSGCAPGGCQGRLLEIAGRVQAGLSLSEAPAFRAVLFTGVDGGGQRLLLVAHHLVVDVVSWRILLEDLEALAGQVRAGRDLVLPAKSSSWQQWAARLAQEAGSAETLAEAAYWREQGGAAVRPVPLDRPLGSDGNVVARSRVVEVVLGVEETRAVLREVPAVFGARVDDVLLTGVAGAVGAWTGDVRVRVDVEGHGREELFEDVDVSRTVGWFTTISPLCLPVPVVGGLGEGLKRVKELLRARPRRGVGYGLLAHGQGVVLEGVGPAQISFNHLGQFDGSFAAGFAASMGEVGAEVSPENRRSYLIDIVSSVEGGRLRMRWIYSDAVHDEETIRRVAEDVLEVLRGLAGEVGRGDVQGYSPSDLPLTGLDQGRINTLVGGLRSHPAWRSATSARPLDDCYPQTPVQQGMWFQSRYAQGEGAYHVQQVLGIDQDLDVEAFRDGWAQVMRRHPILRTSFWAGEDSGPLQVVWADLPVPLRTEDWRSGTALEQRVRLEDYLRQDRVRGFEPEDAPQWRMLLARTGDHAYQLIWSAHHTILDGWSISLILGDAVQWYGALTQGKHLETMSPRPYRDYVSWLGRQDLQQAEAYWRDTLQDVEQATTLSVERYPASTSTTPSASTTRPSSAWLSTRRTPGGCSISPMPTG